MKPILNGMGKKGFYWIGFSREFSDVLFISIRRNPLSRRGKLDLTLHKYRAGAERYVRLLMRKDPDQAQPLLPNSGASMSRFGLPTDRTARCRAAAHGLPSGIAEVRFVPHHAELGAADRGHHA